MRSNSICMIVCAASYSAPAHMSCPCGVTSSRRARAFGRPIAHSHSASPVAACHSRGPSRINQGTLMSASAVTSVRSRLCIAALTLALAVGGAAAARADEVDPPTRAARLSYIQGSVSFQPAGAQEWVAPPVNRPLTTGDQLWADRDSRAELQLDGSALRVGATTSLAFLDLSDHITQVQLSAGTLIVHVRDLYDQETYEIDTPNLAFTVLRSGTYRIAVDPDGGTTTINVRRGQGEVTGGGTAYSLYDGEDDVFAGTDQLVETAQTPSSAP